MEAQRHEIFLYGVGMDSSVLRANGIEPGPARRAHVDGFALRIGRRATLVPRAHGCVHGLVVALAPESLATVWALAAREGYQSEGVLAWVDGEAPRPALSFRASREPAADERDEDYARQLQGVLERLGFPRDYVHSIAGTADIG
jgi:hypothetical protein